MTGRTGGRHRDDLVDARDARRHHCHEDGRRVRGPAPGHVHADPLERRDALAQPRAGRVAEAPRALALAQVEGADALRGEAEIAARGAGQVAEGSGEVGGGHLEPRGREPHAVQTQRPVEQRPIAATADVGDDAADARLDGAARLLPAALEPPEPCRSPRGAGPAEEPIQAHAVFHRARVPEGHPPTAPVRAAALRRRSDAPRPLTRPSHATRRRPGRRASLRRARSRGPGGRRARRAWSRGPRGPRAPGSRWREGRSP